MTEHAETAPVANDRVGGLDVDAIRRDFPILTRTVGEHPLVYLDSAATSHKPTQVIEAEADFFRCTTRTPTGASICWARRRPRPTRVLGPSWPGSSAHPSPRRSCSREA